jgi:hypothetical protein
VTRPKIIFALIAAAAAVLASTLSMTAAVAAPTRPTTTESSATACVATAIDLNGAAASVAPYTGTSTLTCTEPTSFTLRFLIDGQQVKETAVSTGTGTVTVDGTLTAADAPDLSGGEKICFEVHSSGAREASGCLITPTPPAGSGDCVGLQADVERFAVENPDDTRYFGDATIRCYYPTDLGGRLTVAGATVFSGSYPDAPPGDIPVFDGVPANVVNDQPGQEVCWFARVYGQDAVGACDTYDD